MPQVQEVQKIQMLNQEYMQSIEREIDRIRAAIRQEEIIRADNAAKESLAKGLEGLEVLTANGSPVETVRTNNLIDDLTKTPYTTSQELQRLADKHKAGYARVVALNRALKYEAILNEVRTAKIKAIERIAAGEPEPAEKHEPVFDKAVISKCPGAASGALQDGFESAFTTRGP